MPLIEKFEVARGPIAKLKLPPANIAPHLKTAKRDRFVVLPVIPNAFKCTEGSGMLGEVCFCPSICMRAFDPIVPVVRSGLRRHNNQRGHCYGHHVTEAFSLGPALAFHIDKRSFSSDFCGSTLGVLTVAVMTNCKTRQRNDSPIKSNGM